MSIRYSMSSAKKKFRKYQCKDCGKQFDYMPIVSNIASILAKPFIFIDPAPTPLSLFKRARCPECGSKNLVRLQK